MARSRSTLAVLMLAVAAAIAISSFGLSFVSTPANTAASSYKLEKALATSGFIAATNALATAPAFAASFDDEPEEEEGFDFRIIATLALPGFAVFWAGFNVWRVLFRQTGRQMESAQGSAKPGLRAED
mmetsp:Transcript_104820/g.186448  ORF Transcript_104820/g.186448 Transcript_104820/m.186448 type:complete len:128 (-) Transcript_104820:139-522(-)